MKRVSCLFAVFLLALTSLARARPEELLTEGSATTVFRGGGEPRLYTLLQERASVSYSFCGQGELELLTRAVLDVGQELARYRLELTIDGARPGTEIAHRVGPIETGLFDEVHPAGSLRRRTFALPRGCHTIELRVLSTTARGVAVRTTFDVQQQTRREWVDASGATGGRMQLLTVGDSATAYRELAPGEQLGTRITGPAWVRVLARPLDQPQAASFELQIARRKTPLRAVSISSEPSGRAQLRSDPRRAVGRAREVVFRVGAGRHDLRVGSDATFPLLIRLATARAREEPRASAVDFRGRLSSYYDDNILRYSDKFVERFEQGRDPRRFRVETLDDVIHRVDLDLSRTFEGLGGRDAELAFDVEHRAYGRNDIKDWSRLGLSLTQELRRGRELGLTVRLTPNFYVRHIRDSDLTGGSSTVDPFQAFEFEVLDARFDFEQPLATTLNARYHLGVGRYRHSPAFREFDSTNLFGGARLDQRVTRRVRLSYGFELTDSSARGYDTAGERLETSDDTDPTYRQLDLMAAIRWRGSGPRRHTLFLQAEQGQREYTTDKPRSAAPLHSGREDDILRIFGSWQFDLSRRYQLTIFAQARDRSSTAPIELDIGVEKDYEQFESGIRLTARFGR